MGKGMEAARFSAEVSSVGWGSGPGGLGDGAVELFRSQGGEADGFRLPGSPPRAPRLAPARAPGLLAAPGGSAAPAGLFGGRARGEGRAVRETGLSELFRHVCVAKSTFSPFAVA